MAEKTESGRSSQLDARRPNGRVQKIVSFLILFLCGGFVGYVYGTFSASRDLKERDARILELTDKDQQTQQEIARKNSEMRLLQTQLDEVHAEMATMTPSKNTYEISPNHSIIAANGQLTVGLLGSPRGETLDININGKHISAAAGDVVKISPSAASVCEVRIQSFDMFKAVITASCEVAKVR